MDVEIYKFLFDYGCCDICCLRFLKARGSDYSNVDSFLLKRLCDRIKRPDGEDSTCTTCLGVFQQDLCQEICEAVRLNEEIIKYDCDKVLISISLPLALHLRQLVVWFGLIQKFGDVISHEECPDVPLKEVMKTLLIPKICEVTQKTFDQNGLMVNIFLNYKREDDEMGIVTKMKPELFEKKHLHKKRKTDLITRNAFERYLVPSKLDVDKCIEMLTIPPELTKERLCLDRITVTGPTIFVAGRYRKLSREISQTPWVLKGVQMMENNLQDIIVDGLIEYFGGSKAKERIIFSSSGREDVDVRCLGNGRPFVLEIPDSIRCLLPTDIAEQIEETISKSKLVSVKDLQIVPREDLKYIKFGEENKRKIYRALCCTTDDTVNPELIERLNQCAVPFVIEQKTPLRVLHRRPLLKRPRTIYRVSARLVQDNPRLFTLDVITQAGTYVKELVHGEFGRTTPSLTSLMGQQLDIISLDVMGIELDWPPPRNCDETR